MRTLENVHYVSPGDRALLREVKRTIQALLPGATVLLYGSVARSAQGPESDYDILVLSEAALTRSEKDAVRDAIFDLEMERDVAISTLFYAKSQWDTPLYRAMPLHEQIDRDAILV